MNKFPLIIDQIKSLLKRRNLKYKDLADMLDLSEASIKRIFTSKDCSFNRLEEISKALDLNLGELLQSIDSDQVTNVELPSSLESYFLKNQVLLNIFGRLTFDRWTVPEVQEHFHLSDEEMFQNLKKLDEFKLIVLHPENKITVSKLQPITWSRKKSKLQEYFYLEKGKEVIDNAYNSLEQNSDLILQYYQLSPENVAELRQKLINLEYEFARKTIQDLKTYDGELVQLRTITALAMGSFF